MSPTLPRGHDGLLCDLDGVVYAGGGAVPGAVETLTALAERGVPVGFVTNNASRAPESVAEHLRSLGVPARPEQVFGSAPAGVDLLEDLSAHLDPTDARALAAAPQPDRPWQPDRHRAPVPNAAESAQERG